jgi:RNA polymerase sigma-70 factor (ECF subfamily)
MQEREAIERLRGGDVAGLEYLVRAYQVRAVRTAYFVTRDEMLAQDVVQVAFVKARERIDQFDPARPFGPWFLTSVLRDAVKAARRQGRQVSLDRLADDEEAWRASDPVDGRPGPELLWERAETAAEIRAALDRLGPDQRAAVVARYYLGWTEAQLAEALACPPSTVKWRLHAARQRLRALLRPLPIESEHRS